MSSPRIICFALIFAWTSSSVHAQCSAQLGRVLELTKRIENGGGGTLHYTTCAEFDFKRFKAIEGKLNQKCYFELGFNSRNELKEIIKHDTIWTRKMIVYDFEDLKLILYQSKKDEGYLFAPVIFIVSSKIRYMVNLVPQIGSNGLASGYFEKLPSPNVTDISAIMILSEDLTPKILYRLNNGHIFFKSTIKYVNDQNGIVKKEIASFYLNSKYQEKLKIDINSCFDKNNDEYIPADLVLTLHPSVNIAGKYPLWVFYGAHSYD